MPLQNQEVHGDFYGEIRHLLISKLRTSRLAPLMRDVGKNSGPGFNDLGVISGSMDPAFVSRFGTSLDKLEDADITALTLYLPPQEPLVRALGKLAEHIEAAPAGKTGLPYLDDWNASDDIPLEEVPVVWSNSCQNEARRLLQDGYLVGKSQSSVHGTSEGFVTIFVSRLPR